MKTKPEAPVRNIAFLSWPRPCFGLRAGDDADYATRNVILYFAFVRIFRL